MPDRLAHTTRRARAVALVSSLPAPRQILYICLGNICRSPYAEAASRRDADRWPAPPPVWTSAGLTSPDRPSPQVAIEVAAERGVSLDRHRSRMVSIDLVAASDLIVVMEVHHARELAFRFHRRRGVVVLGDFDPQPIVTRAIADPWTRPREEFVACYERIDRCLAALVGSIRAQPPAIRDGAPG